MRGGGQSLKQRGHHNTAARYNRMMFYSQIMLIPILNIIIITVFRVLWTAVSITFKAAHTAHDAENIEERPAGCLPRINTYFHLTLMVKVRENWL